MPLSIKSRKEEPIQYRKKGEKSAKRNTDVLPLTIGVNKLLEGGKELTGP